MGLCRLGNAYPQIGNYFGLGGETDDTKVSRMWVPTPIPG